MYKNAPVAQVVRAGIIPYDNSSSGLTATNMQDAITELNTIKTNETTSFTEASARENISSGDTVTTIWGKIKKFFSDLKTVAFSGSYNDLTNKPSKLSDFTNDITSIKEYSGARVFRSGYSTADMSQSDAIYIAAWDATTEGEARLRGVKQADLKVAYATSAGSATDSTKVAKSGDTMTGALSFNADMVQIEHRNNSSWYCYEAYETAGNEAMVYATQQGKSSFMWVNGEDRANVANNRWQSLTPGLQIKNNCVSIGKLIGNDVTPSYKLEVNGVTKSTTFDGNLKYTHTNEINFGGGNQSTCYFNYRNADTDQAAAVNSIAYKFCNYSNDTSKSNILAGSFNGYTIQKSVPSNAKFTDTVPDKLKRALLTQRTGTGTDSGLSITCNYSCLLLELTYYGSTFATSLIFNTSSGEQRVSGFVDSASNYVWAKVFITSGKITKLQLQNTNTSVVVDSKTTLNVYILSVST